MTKWKEPTPVERLLQAGISWEDAQALRRISMTLTRWFELECGTEHPANPNWTLAIERDGDEDDSKPFYRVMGNDRNGQYFDKRSPVPDREAGARKRLAKIMKSYPDYRAYVQGDPRGASLYILRPDDFKDGDNIDSIYNRGIAVYK